MAQYYQKINTIFKRDQNPGKYHNCIMPNEGFTQPEFEFLRGCKFECTEKIDGTSMSVHIMPVDYTDIGNSYKVKRWEMDERTALSRSWAQSRLLFSIQQSLL